MIQQSPLPKISIVTVCFNSARTIEETLISIQAQNYPHIEHIIVDGASTDNTLQIVQAHQEKITQIISEPDKGVYDAMNKGIACASGEVIGFLNADDIYASQDVLSQIALVFQDPKIQACYGDLVYFSDKQPEKVYRYWRSRSFVPGLFAKGWCPAHPTFFVRKSVYERCGGFNLSYRLGNDVELMMRFLEKYQIASVYLPRILVKMRLGGISNRGLRNIIIQNAEILKSANKLSIPISPVQFICYKIGNRIWQVLQGVWLSTRRKVNSSLLNGEIRQ